MVTGAEMAIVPLLCSVDNGVNLCDGSGGLLGDGKPMTMEYISKVKRMMKDLRNIFRRCFQRLIIDMAR